MRIFHRFLLGLGVLLPAPALARGALACEVAEPANYFTFAEPWPAPDSEGAFLDTPIVLRGQPFSIGGSPIVLSWFEIETMTLRDAQGGEILVRESTREYSLEYGSRAWVPEAPLEPESEYTVSAALAEQRYERPEEATGSETIEFSFTTGGAVAPALGVDGELTVTLEEGQMPILECDDTCVGGCEEVGTRPALFAHVALPAVDGGVDVEGYRGFVVLTDARPALFLGPGPGDSSAHEVFLTDFVVLAAGEALAVDIELPDEAEAYVPCFGFNVWDVAGHRVNPESICLDAIDPGDVVEPNGTGGRGGEGGVAVSGGSGTTGGTTSTGGTTTTGGTTSTGGTTTAGEGGAEPSEGGEPGEGGAGGATTAPDSSSSDSGCSLGAQGRGTAGVAWLLLALLAVRRIRPRQKA